MLVLLLKSTTLKTITVPGHYRDGTWVSPYQKQVHVDLDKPASHVLSGRGSHSQKLAHKKLSGADWYKKLTPEQQHAILLAEATDIQTAASNSAKVSGWKKHALEGHNPTHSEWMAFYKLPKDKQAELISHVGQALPGTSHLSAPAIEIPPDQPGKGSAADSGSAPISPDAGQDASPIPVKPVWWGKTKPEAHPTIEEAVNLANQGKLRMFAYATPVGVVREFGIFENGMVYTKPSAITMTGAVPADKKWQPVSGKDALNYIGHGVVAKSGKLKIAGLAIYSLVKNKAKIIADAKAAMADMVNSSASNPPDAEPAKAEAPAPSASSSRESRNLAAIDPAEVEAWLNAAPGQAGPHSGFLSKVTEKGKFEFFKWRDLESTSNFSTEKLQCRSAALCSLFGKYDQKLLDDGTFIPVGDALPEGRGVVVDPSFVKAAALKDSAQKPDADVQHGPKDGDTKLGANGTLVFKDGRWHEQQPSSPSGAAFATVLDAKQVAASAIGTVTSNGVLSNSYMTRVYPLAIKGDVDGVKGVLGTVPATYKHTKKAIIAIIGRMEAAQNGRPKAIGIKPSGEGRAVADSVAAGSENGNAAQQPAGNAPGPNVAGSALDFSAHKLPESNVNAKSVNKKLAAIEAAFNHGDASALAAMSFGSNTYGKKLSKLRDAAYAMLAATAPAAKVSNPVSEPATASTPASAPVDSPAVAQAAPPPQKQTATQLVLWNTSEGHNKFWSVHVDGTNVVTTYGKIGSAGKSTIKSFPTQAAATAALAALIDQKTKKGYFHKTSKQVEVGAAAPAVAPKKSPIGIPNASSQISQLPGYKNLNVVAASVLKKAAQAAEDGDIEKVEAALSDLKLTTGAVFAPVVERMLASLKSQQADLAKPDQAVSPTQHGPKDGDTKTENGKTYVLRGGRWHLVASPDAAGEQNAAAEPVAAGAPTDISGWAAEGGQDGYNDGGFFKAPDGQRYYVKFTGEDVARSELLANALYDAVGINVPQMQLITRDGKVGTASKVIPGLKKDPAALKAGTAKSIYGGFAADVWLGNRDVVGNNPKGGWDNIQFVDGMPVRIDAGGALHYTGTGKKKGAGEFGDVPKELDGFFTKNPNSAKAFGGMTEQDKSLSAASLAQASNAKIDALVAKFMGTGPNASKLASTLKSRRDYLLSKLAPGVKAAQEAKAPTGTNPKAVGVIIKKKSALEIQGAAPDPRHLKVSASQLIAPHDFLNWNGAGKPISDKPYVQQNIADEKAMYETALKGDLVSFSNYKFQPVDKMTGAPAGSPLPIAEHPSAHVKSFYGSLLDALSVIANPAAKKLAEWIGLPTKGVSELNEYFPAHKYGVNVAQVAADERLGFWIALGKVGNWKDWVPAPKDIEKLSASDKAAAHKYPSSLKKWLLAVKGSGSANQPYRDGKDFDNSKNFAREVIDQAYKYGRSEPEGSTIYKWIDFNSEMLKNLVDSEEGLVFQNPGSMCCSMSGKGTKGFGKHRLTIRYAKGAVALPNYALGSFDSEQEITTIPGARFMLLSKKLDVHGNGAHDFELLMLPPDPGYITDVVKKTEAYKAGKDWKDA